MNPICMHSSNQKFVLGFCHFRLSYIWVVQINDEGTRQPGIRAYITVDPRSDNSEGNLVLTHKGALILRMGFWGPLYHIYICIMTL